MSPLPRTHTLLAALAVAAAFAVTACGSDSGPGAGGPSSGGPTGIGGQYVSDGLPDPPFPDGSAPVRLSLADGRISFTAGCNRFAGEATWDDGVLRTSQLTGTEMGCQSDLMAQDEWLVDFFSSRPVVALDGTDLKVGSGADAIWFVPADEVSPSEQPGDAGDLVGPTWTLTGIGQIDGDSVGMLQVPDDVTATLVFTAGGEVQAQYGCNSGGGTYEVQGETIVFSHMVSTMMACSDARAEVESGVVEVLMAERPVGWVISGDELRLTSVDGRHELAYHRG